MYPWWWSWERVASGSRPLHCPRATCSGPVSHIVPVPTRNHVISTKPASVLSQWNVLTYHQLTNIFPMELTSLLMDNGHCDPSLDALGNGAGLWFSWDKLLLLPVSVFWIVWCGRRQEREVWRKNGNAIYIHCYSKQWGTGQGPRKSQILIWL